MSDTLNLKQINILLLGETGVGKSTFINALANYVSYETLEEAEIGQIISKIGTSFEFLDDDFNTITVKANKDSNESSIVGQSATQKCKSYIFSFGDGDLVRIIDTPGIGDTRGLDQDKKNFESILQLINMCKKLHAVCILLKANHSRITQSFSYCLKQLLSQLHQSVHKNIVFVFTHGKSVNFNPGGAVNLLKKLLDDVKQNPPYVEIKINKNIAYCLENEAFNYLLARNDKHNFPDNDYAKSWKKSSDECGRLLKYIGTLTPHDVRDTVNIITTRLLLGKIVNPIFEIIQHIEDNLTLLEKHKRDVEMCSNNIEELRKLMYTPSVELKSRRLKNPKLVCTSKKCVQIYDVGGTSRYHYSQTCCPDCGDWKHLFGHGNYVKFTSKSFFGKYFCSRCDCPQIEHELIYSETQVIKVRKQDKDIFCDITTEEKEKENIKLLAKNLKDRFESFEAEREVILKSMAKFYFYIHYNAVVAHEDNFKDKLKQKIVDLKNQKESTKRTDGILNALKMYEEEKNILDKAIKSNSVFTVTTTDINRIKEDLATLKLNGDHIKRIYTDQERLLDYDGFNEGNRLNCNSFFNKYLGWGSISELVQLPDSQLPDNPTSRRPNFPTTQLPDSPTSRQPNFPKPQLPDRPTSRQLNFPTDQLPDNPTSRQTKFPTTQLPDNPTSRQTNFPTTQLPKRTNF